MLKDEALIQKLVEKRRLATLLFLADEPDLCLSVNLLQVSLESYLKHVNSDDIAADTDFLRLAGLVTLEHIGPRPALRLTQAGRETARGTRRVQGVQPLPLD